MRRRLAIAARVAGLAAAITLALMTATGHVHNVPACPEDAVLVGVGEFADGRWSDLACGPALDDLSR